MQLAIAPAKVSSIGARSSPAYRALLVFSILYFSRPEDLLPGLNYIPIAKIAGAIAILSLMLSLRGRRRLSGLAFEVKLLIILWGWLFVAIPFAWWKGGAFDTVFNRFSKCALIALLVSVVVTSSKHLKQLLAVQALCVSLTGVASIVLYHGGRMGGFWVEYSRIRMNCRSILR